MGITHAAMWYVMLCALRIAVPKSVNLAHCSWLCWRNEQFNTQSRLSPYVCGKTLAHSSQSFGWTVLVFHIVSRFLTMEQRCSDTRSLIRSTCHSAKACLLWLESQRGGQLSNQQVWSTPFCQTLGCVASAGCCRGIDARKARLLTK